MKGFVLVVDDDPALTATLSQYLASDSFAVTEAHSTHEALRALERRPYDFVVTDVKMPGMNGLEFCERVVADYPDLPVFIVTALASLQTAIEAIRVGAYDFITKPVNKDELLNALNRALKKRQVHQISLEASRPSPEAQECFGEIIGDSLTVQNARRILQQVSSLSSTLLLEGEQGTGKSLLARLAHDGNQRSKVGKLVIVRCKDRDPSSLSEELFSRRDVGRTGRDGGRSALERASGGTLYLSGVEHIPLELQARLLALLEDNHAAIKSGRGGDVDFRLICSCETRLESCVQTARFRSDLQLYLSSITVPLAPLRERGADILLLANYFLKEISRRLGKRVTGLTQSTTERLMLYTWPGNVSELLSVMEGAVARARSEHIRVEDLPEQVKAYRNIPLDHDPEASNRIIPLDQLEQRHILTVLKQLGGNKTLAARALGLDRKTLYRKLEQYGYDGGENI